VAATRRSIVRSASRTFGSAGEGSEVPGEPLDALEPCLARWHPDLGFVIERRSDVTVKRCVTARTGALAILYGRRPIVLEVDSCSPICVLPSIMAVN
jgi:hypothetical protein